MKYETPSIEIVKFQKENILLKASGEVVTEVLPEQGGVTPDKPFE